MNADNACADCGHPIRQHREVHHTLVCTVDGCPDCWTPNPRLNIPERYRPLTVQQYLAFSH